MDVRDTLKAHKDEYIYYRTDHHWTSLGAYYAYSQLCEALGLTPFDPAAHTALTRDGFYGTHYSKARTWNAVPDTITYYELQNALTIWNVTGPGQPTEGTTTGLYDTDKLNVYDKYAMFLHGNNGLSRVEGRQRKDPRHQGQLRQLLCALPDGQLRCRGCGGFPQLQLRAGPTHRRQRL